ncbi:MAG: hypothetical protein MUF43_12750 [Flavobacterium sp.]|jgi:hypothetical protein|nr:hypothetical protein [Flavobacterium sp.]
MKDRMEFINKLEKFKLENPDLILGGEFNFENPDEINYRPKGSSKKEGRATGKQSGCSNGDKNYDDVLGGGNSTDSECVRDVAPTNFEEYQNLVAFA